KVSLYVPGAGGTFDIKVYSLGYRKVQDVTVQNVRVGAPVTIDLLDKAGVSLSNGLYYLVVTTPQGRRSLKLLILR
ncbi:MAG TPA: hypothetical protein VJ873_08200, partial [bacterium]|nr:hypothetical protein [bacterium]